MNSRFAPRIWIALLLLLCSAPFVKGVNADAVQQGGRYALVIGNSHYGGGADVSGIKDADQMAKFLRQLNFSVVTLHDGKLEEVTKKLSQLGTSIRQASVVIFFFSGHGFQNGTENYLLPVDGSVDTGSALPLADVKNVLALAPNEAVKLVFLDACREEKRLPNDAPKGLKAEQTPTSPGTLYAFAAGPSLTTPAGNPDEFSPYSTALLHYLREPGLKITEFLDKVGSDLAGIGQLPQYVINGVPSDFYLRDPVYVRAKIDAVDGQLLVLREGEVVLNSSQKTEDRLRLKAGENHLSILISKGKSYHNNHDWDVTEGWSYSLRLGLREEGGISCSGPGRTGFCFSGHEETPFKDGPHHGKTFEVAKATLFVDPATAEVRLEDPDTEIWNRDAPAWARDQDLLYDQSVTSLNLTPEDILSAVGLQTPWNVLLRPVVQEVLTSGNLLGNKVADPSRTFATVRGNRALRNAVQICMNQQKADRLRDLKVSIAAVFARNPRPFEGFDQGLTDCVRKVEQDSGSPIQAADIRIWTAIEDRSSITQNVFSAGAATAGRTPAIPDPSPTLRNVQGGSRE